MNTTILSEPSDFAKKYYGYVNACGYIDDAKFHINRNFFDNYLIMGVNKGELILIQYGNTYHILKNEYIVLDLHHPHEYYFTPGSDTSIYWSHANGIGIELLCKQLHSLSPFPIIKQNTTITSFLKEIIDSAKVYDENLVSLKLYNTFMCVFNDLQNPHHLSKEANEVKDFKIQVNNYINAHIHEPISLDAFAGEMNLSKFYFIKKCKRLLNKTPMEYIIHEKMKLASYYLLNTDNKLETIAHMVGFSDVTYFLKVFKRKMGVTPKQYKKFFV